MKANGALFPRTSSDDYFDRTAKIEEADNRAAQNGPLSGYHLSIAGVGLHS